MKAVILAAGQGTRLQPLTLDRPKCMVELIDVPILVRQVHTLREAGVTDISVVAGYRSEKIEAVEGIRIIHNPEYETTNMVESLFCARELFDGTTDLLVCYGDIVYEPRVLQKTLLCNAPVCLPIDKKWRRYWQARMDDPLNDAETLKLDEGGNVRELGKKPESYDDIQGQYIGLIKFRSDSAAQLDEVSAAMDPDAMYDGKDFKNMYMTSFIQHLIDIGWTVRSVPIDNGWLEVDTLEDLERYRQLYDRGELQQFYRIQPV